MTAVNDNLKLQYNQPIAGNMVVVDDEMYFYYGGAWCTFCNTDKTWCRHGLAMPRG